MTETATEPTSKLSLNVQTENYIKPLMVGLFTLVLAVSSFLVRLDKQVEILRESLTRLEQSSQGNQRALEKFVTLYERQIEYERRNYLPRPEAQPLTPEGRAGNGAGRSYTLNP